MILADEGLNGKIVFFLREQGFELNWLAETSAGISDSEVLELAKKEQRILITEDKDFGG
ncbi:MAG: DUF5615 family PIN-like protein [Bacteroidota bacterium]